LDEEDTPVAKLFCGCRQEFAAKGEDSVAGIGVGSPLAFSGR